MAAPRLYVVGGAVRDALLGLPAADRDWVAVGSTPEELLAAGYRPVGRDFPVFLHPQTNEEVALARTERKTARGYHGFVFHADPGVTLEQDLARRDLTINAIAQAEDGSLVDPFGGQRDLQARVLRHVSDAFVEDPVRLLRLARLAARFSDFSIAPETRALLRRMVEEGEVDALVAERVWQELSRGLMTAAPLRMLQVLQECGALARLLPALAALPPDAWQAAQAALQRAAAQAAPLPVRWACLVAPAGAAAAHAMGQGLRVPTDCQWLAATLAREGPTLQATPTLDAAATLALLERCDALRRPQRLELLLQAQAAASGQPEPLARLPALLRAAQAVDSAAVAAQAAAAGLQGPAVGQAVRLARQQAIAAAM